MLSLNRSHVPSPSPPGDGPTALPISPPTPTPRSRAATPAAAVQHDDAPNKTGLSPAEVNIIRSSQTKETSSPTTMPPIAPFAAVHHGVGPTTTSRSPRPAADQAPVSPAERKLLVQQRLAAEGETRQRARIEAEEVSCFGAIEQQKKTWRHGVDSADTRALLLVSPRRPANLSTPSGGTAASEGGISGSSVEVSATSQKETMRSLRYERTAVTQVSRQTTVSAQQTAVTSRTEVLQRAVTSTSSAVTSTTDVLEEAVGIPCQPILMLEATGAEAAPMAMRFLPSVSPLTSPVSSAVSSDEEGEGNDEAKGRGEEEPKVVGEDGTPSTAAGGMGRMTPTLGGVPSKVPQPRSPRVSGGLDALRVYPTTSSAAAAATSPRPSLSRSSIGALTPRASLAGIVSSGGRTAAGGEEAAVAAAAELKEMRHTLAEKEREITRLTRELGKAGQVSEKAQKKSAELQEKLASEKTASAAYKKETSTQRQTLQGELRQAQAACRAAQQAQDKLQKEVEKLQKDRQAAGTSSSASSTPATTPRSRAAAAAAGSHGGLASQLDAATSAQLSKMQNENATMRKTIEQLKGELAAAAGSSEALEKARGAMSSMEKEVYDLRHALQQRETSLESRREELARSQSAMQALKAKLEMEPAQTDAGVAAVINGRMGASSPSSWEDSPSNATRPLSPVGLHESSPTKATAQLQGDLVHARKRAALYQQKYEEANHRVEQLENEVAASCKRETTADEHAKRLTEQVKNLSADLFRVNASKTDLLHHITSLEGKLASTAETCVELRQRIQERSEEAITLQSTLQEVEEDRDAKARQLRALQSQAALAEKDVAERLREQENRGQEKLEGMQMELRSLKEQLSIAMRSQQVKEAAALEALRSKLHHAEEQLSSLEAEKATALEAAHQEAAQSSAKQKERFRKKMQGLTRKLAEAEHELSMLGEEYTHVCRERDAAFSRCRAVEGQAAMRQNRVEPLCPATSNGTPVGTPRAAAVAVTDRRGTSAAPPLSSQRLESVSRDLSNALCSAHRPCHPAGIVARTAGAFSSSSASVLHTHLHAQELTRYVVSSPVHASVSRSPARARSPQATHALDGRYFDPTVLQGRDVSVVPGEGLARRRSSSPRAIALDASVSVPRRCRAYSVAALAPSLGTPSARSSSPPVLPSVYLPLGRGTAARDGSDALGHPCSPPHPLLELQFNCSAGRLLVSQRGHRVHRPVFTVPTAPGVALTAGVDGDVDEAGEVCCAAVASISHALYAARAAAERLYHIQHIYCFTIRVLQDCEAGDILCGFADRHIPRESFGAKQNALRYGGCHYLSLRSGCLFAPGQGVRGEDYEGWRAATDEASERRRHQRAAILQAEDAGATGGLSRSQTEGEQEAQVGSDALHASHEVSLSSLRRPWCVVRAGDEVTCILHIDERTIRYAWNGVECGVAFRDVSLSPSLYPCVEVNASGATVELL